MSEPVPAAAAARVSSVAGPGVATGDTVSVASRRGEITTKVKVVESTNPGTVFMSFHYSESPVNVLTNPATCPTAKIPEYKVCAVKIQKI